MNNFLYFEQTTQDVVRLQLIKPNVKREEAPVRPVAFSLFFDCIPYTKPVNIMGFVCTKSLISYYKAFLDTGLFFQKRF